MRYSFTLGFTLKAVVFAASAPYLPAAAAAIMVQVSAVALVGAGVMFLIERRA